MTDQQKKFAQGLLALVVVAVLVWQKWPKSADPEQLGPAPSAPTTPSGENDAPSHPGGATETRHRSADSSLPHIEINFEHILHGQINRRGDLVGMHHLPSAPKTLRVGNVDCQVQIELTSPGGKDDVRSAHVRLIDPNTQRTVREKFSTLYPESWTRADIQTAILTVYADALAKRRINAEGFFSGDTRNLHIEGYVTKDRDLINTAYPVLKAKGKSP